MTDSFAFRNAMDMSGTPFRMLVVKTNQTKIWRIPERSPKQFELCVRCKLCQRHLSYGTPADNVRIEDFVTLPCGHAFGFNCFNTIYNLGTRNCPTCQSTVLHACGHPPKFQRSGTNQVNEIITRYALSADVPFPAKCRDCVHPPGHQKSCPCTCAQDQWMIKLEFPPGWIVQGTE
ncbi:hypothetical protein GGS20DRAFT_412468 [Poronia punctata]|nr:hypothetical protein GGS20DRAFT_412468 [Poronia punctata]